MRQLQSRAGGPRDVDRLLHRLHELAVAIADMPAGHPLALAGALSGLRQLRIWLDAATEDPWLERDQQLHDILVGRSIDHSWHIFAGMHGQDYWDTHAIDYLHFYEDALTRQ